MEKAVAQPNIRGCETVEKAKRAAAHRSIDLYVQTGIMVGRRLLGKPQDVEFGKDKCEHLGDIAARLRQLVG